MKDTKKKLLHTAVRLFSQYGIDGVSTRDLAKKANVNLCSINYYFGSKQKLYEAAVAEVSAFILNNFIQPAMEYVSQSRGRISPRDELKMILCRFFDFLCGEKMSEIPMELLVKEFFNPSSAYEQFYTPVFEPVHKHMSRLIAEDLGTAEDNLQVILLAHTLLGQSVIFRIHKEALFRRLGIKKYTPELIAEIQERMMKNCDADLDKAKEA